MSKSNQSWLEAYEAQKAKRIESMKNGVKNPFSLSGLEKQSVEKTKIQKPIKQEFQSHTPKVKYESQRVQSEVPSVQSEILKVQSEVSKVEREIPKFQSKPQGLGLHKPYSNPDNFNSARPRKNSIDNSIHERIEAEKLASIEAFSKPVNSTQNGANNLIEHQKQLKPSIDDKKRKLKEEPSIHSLFKKVKNDAKKDVKDWQKEYEEKKRLAMEKLKR